MRPELSALKPESGVFGRASPLRRLLPVALAVAALVLVDRAAHYAAERWALAGVRTAAEAAAMLRVAVLQSEVEKQRSLPVVLAQDPDVRTALETKDATRLDALNIKLEALSEGTRAAVIYLLDASGMTIAASNWRTPTSFVGNDYSFRDYFRWAVRDGAAEHFAFGTVSQRPGLFLTRRVDGPTGLIGVVVVKAEFDAVEANWRSLAEPTFVTDERSIVLVTSEPDWRFRTTAPLSPESQAAIRTSLLYGDAPLNLLPIRSEGEDRVEARLPGAAAERSFVQASAAVPTTRWTLHLLAPTREAVRLSATAWRALALLGSVVGLGMVGFWLARRRRLADERAREAAMRRDLAARVETRTAELRDTNNRLVAEIDERRRAQSALQTLQDELVQSSKLAVLGQIAASVAHEINQPVAAIRTYAENAQTLLARADVATATGNLATITSLSDRIGTITQELRAFARKSSGEVGAVPLRAAIDGALLLVGHRLRQQAIDFSVEIDKPEVTVAAELIRLEQVLVNLLQNAVEALSGRPDGRIRIAATTTPERVSLTVADNGPGLAAEVMQSLFIPFTTTKPTGLGLGLVISHDIVAEFGGTFTAENTGDGALFTITLPRPA